MLIDAADFDDANAISLSADVVIAGAGTVGLFIASRLAKCGRSVMIVEAGRRVAEAADPVKCVGKDHNGARIGRAIGLGGTSTLWGGQLAEFEERDLRRSECPWPLSYDELAGWYNETYRALGLPGLYSAAQFQRALRIPRQEHSTIEHFFTSWLPQPNFAILLKDKTVLSRDIEIILNATVDGFRFDEGRCVELSAAVPSGRRLTIRGGAYIIAAGTLASSQLFLTAQRRDDVPWRENELVGAYFHDHLGGPVADLKIKDERRFRAFFENGFALGRKVQPKLRFQSNALSWASTSVCGFFSFDSSLSEQLANTKRLIRGFRSGLAFSSLRTIASDAFKLGGTLLPIAVRFVRDRRILALFDRGVRYCVQAEQIPIRGSRIRLADSSGRTEGPLPIALEWQVDGGELDSIRRFARETNSYLECTCIGSLQFEESFWNNDAMLLSQLSDTYHQCGGLRMSAQSRNGVVDPECRVWGSTNVFVAGSAVFPTSSYANTTLTSLAMAARLSATLERMRF